MALMQTILLRNPLDYTEVDRRDAADHWAQVRAHWGFGPSAPLLTPPDANVKLAKTKRPVYGLSLAPARESGFNVCPHSTPLCRAGCVAFAGKGELPRIQAARIAKTQFLAKHPLSFLRLLQAEIERAIERHDEQIGVRLNTFSDIPWERVAPQLLASFHPKEVLFYDYTKDWSRESIAIYHLTYSASERTSEAAIEAACCAGRNVAVVFDTKRGHELPRTHLGIPVIDADESDDRTADPRGVIVGLRAKGRMRRKEYLLGFVREVKPVSITLDDEGRFVRLNRGVR